MTSTTRTGRTKRVVTSSNITVQSYALNQAPLLYVQRITTLDSVVGWGTLRIPVAGNPSGSAPIPVLLERRSFVEQDSFYLNGQPAPAALLNALGQTQGVTSSTYRQRFFRQNAAQPVLNIAYADSRYATPTGAAYSDEQSIPLGTQAARTVTGGGLLAWPNPAVAGQPLQFALAASTPGQPLHICLRDATAGWWPKCLGPMASLLRSQRCPLACTWPKFRPLMAPAPAVASCWNNRRKRHPKQWAARKAAHCFFRCFWLGPPVLRRCPAVRLCH